MNFLTIQIQNFQITSYVETIKIKVVDLKKLCNFVVTTFLFEIIYISMKIFV
jgi:hypothetical protein